MTTNWKEDFDKDFLITIDKYDDNTVVPERYRTITFNPYITPDNIKNFITTLLEKQREEYVENIKGLQYEHANVARHGDTPDDAYDRVLNYLEFELKSHDKTS